MVIILFFFLHWYLSLFCQTFFLHRYGAHAMFSMSKGWEKFFFILTFISQGSSYLSVRPYAVLHRMHHAFSDTEKDPHSPHHTHNIFTMMLKTRDIYNDMLERKILPDPRFSKGVPDWEKFDNFADNNFVRFMWGVFYSLIYILCISVLELPYTHWAMYFLLPVHFLMGPIHGAIVNWGGHKYGYSNFDNNDKSKNTLFFDFLTMGELFQNNHHKLPRRVDFGVRWFEVDPTYPIVRLLHMARIIKIKKKHNDIPEERQVDEAAMVK